ncbi:MAG: CHRD domain-containing protein, partial [Acidobacteriota bacterium]|nr:CHRD domain-containing protein [Acidobacteriota bacterium]
MTRRSLFVSFAIAVCFAGSLSAQTLGAVLTGSQETPTPCATTGSGNATVTFDSTRQNINVTITVSGLGSPITSAHIHIGAAGSAPGSVVLGFTPAASFTNGTLTGTFPITSDLATQILQNPANYYVNVHTSQCPSGAIRGQLALVTGGSILYAAELRGSKETPPNSSNSFGSSLVTFDPSNSTLAFEVATSGITGPSASHVHRGAAGAAGPVIINFATSAAAFLNGRASGSGAISTLQSSSFLATDLAALASAGTANGYYVNVH